MICLVIILGLAVDYSSHIGYKFMLFAGTGEERAKAALVTIGPAVFNGAFSTLLAFILLASSTLYTGTTLFKVIVNHICSVFIFLIPSDKKS